MELGVLVRMGAFDLGTHEASVEMGVVAFAGAVVLGLLVAKARRAHVQKMRKAASSGYYDFDVARYGGTAPGRSLIESESAGPQSVSSSFSAPRRGSRRKDRSSASIPPVPPPFAPNPQGADLAFAAASPPGSPATPLLPPPPGSASAPLPPPPSAAAAFGADGGEPEGSALPLLVPPPPPPPSSPPPPPPAR